ncbi:MAG TPA: hypothetical protein PLE32_04725 [Haliscomenobacter sp.]|nr:hypothetical protein [Haliscomenobacter sp.]
MLGNCREGSCISLIRPQQLYNFVCNVSVPFLPVVNMLDVVMVPKDVRNHVLQYG